MVRLVDVQARVAERYARPGMPAWPDPHAGLASPRDEEYSRITEPERYRIVHARARAWVTTLSEVPGVEAETLPVGSLPGTGVAKTFERGVRLASARPGTVPLLLLESDVPLTEQEGFLAVLQISVVQPETTLATLPDCGCDACDCGSVDLIDAIDGTIGDVVGGPVVLMRGRGWHASWRRAAGASDGTTTRGRSGPGPAHRDVMEWCRGLAAGEEVRLPEGVEAVVGRPWLDCR